MPTIDINQSTYPKVLDTCYANLKELTDIVTKLRDLYNNDQILKAYSLVEKLNTIINKNYDILVNTENNPENIQKTINFTYKFVLLVNRIDTLLYNLIITIKQIKNSKEIKKDTKLIDDSYFKILDSFNFSIKVDNENNEIESMTNNETEEEPEEESNVESNNEENENEEINKMQSEFK